MGRGRGVNEMQHKAKLSFSWAFRLLGLAWQKMIVIGHNAAEIRLDNYTFLDGWPEGQMAGLTFIIKLISLSLGCRLLG